MFSRILDRLIPPASFPAFLIWGLIFALAYAQSPLYTSNQNQYFLHGIALAGFGELDQDWLANTLDPTPVFSALVFLVYSGMRWEGWFYFIYAGLMGVYLYSLWICVNTVFRLWDSQVKSAMFLALLIVLTSAGWRFALSHGLGANWTYIFEDGVADQRMLGPVLQPSTFGVFLLFSVALYLHGKPYLGVAAAVLSATVHPTYVLSSAVLTVVYMWDAYHYQRSTRQAMQLGLLGLILVLPTLLASYTVFASASLETARAAQQILVDFRIPHHAVVSQWFDLTAVVKIAFLCAALVLVRRTKLYPVLLIPAAAVGLLTLAQILLDSDSLALLFPWRISTFLVPLSTAIILAACVQRITEVRWARSEQGQKALLIASLLMIGCALLVGAIRFAVDLDRRASEAEQPLLAYVSANRAPGDLYLIPLKMQDFRLETGAPALVDFKSIPYKAEEVLEWYRRVKLVHGLERGSDCAILSRIAAEYPLTHVIIESDQKLAGCSQIEELYSDQSYQLFRLK
jgi:hypothetical protein